ncbi:6814_t:CDS:1, partial [Funneliformis geosporum]
NITANPWSPSKKQNTVVACTGCIFHEKSQYARLPVAIQRLLCGNLIDIDLFKLIILPQLTQKDFTF